MPITADRRLIKRLLSKHGEEASRQLIELHRADTLGQSSICIPRLATFETANAMIDELLQEEKCFSLKDLAVNGNDMMAIGLRESQSAMPCKPVWMRLWMKEWQMTTQPY